VRRLIANLFGPSRARWAELERREKLAQETFEHAQALYAAAQQRGLLAISMMERHVENVRKTHASVESLRLWSIGADAQIKALK
jgi:hypothetical protein